MTNQTNTAAFVQNQSALNNTPAQETTEQQNYEFWINSGYMAEVSGKTYFIDIAGSPLEWITKKAVANPTSAFDKLRNALIANYVKIASELAPGESRIIQEGRVAHEIRRAGKAEVASSNDLMNQFDGLF